MIYYRVAFQAHPSPTWAWKSTMLTSLEAVFGFLKLYSAVPQDRLRVFSSSSREAMNEQLVRENNGIGTNSVTAAQFLQERKIGVRETTERSSEPGGCESQEMGLVAVSVHRSLNQSRTRELLPDEGHISAAGWRRVELERGPGGDHDTPYTFASPTSLPQALAWIRLLGKVQRGELAP